MKFELNHSLLATDWQELTNALRALKGILGLRWQRPMAAEQRELCRLKLRATELCVLRAQARGRRHLQAVPAAGGGSRELAAILEYEARVAERLAPVYALSWEQSA